MSPRLTTTVELFNRRILPERWRQTKRWGMQALRDGTGGEAFIAEAEYWKECNDENAGTRNANWTGVLLEEVYEALSETDEEKLANELAQVAAVALAWLEDIERRQRLAMTA